MTSTTPRLTIGPARLPRRAALGLAAAALPWFGASAQAWPTQPLRVVVPFAPGGPTDVQARMVMQGLASRLGQPVVIDNRAGAGGNIGAAYVARATADGHTLLAGTVGTNAINQSLFTRMEFDPAKDLAPAAFLGTAPNVLIVNRDFPAADVAALIAAAKARPGQISYASPGNGTSNHLAMELFKSRAGIDLTNVTYRGAGPALQDVVAGHVPVMFNGLDNALPAVRAGQVRALAVSSSTRAPLLPDVPAIAETLAGFETASWTMLFAPAGTPATVIARLNQEVAAVIAAEPVAGRFRELGLAAPAMSPAELRAFVAAEAAKWADAVRASGARVES
jgi:tripartite-type tricarboxylate transporter receptor subunit TctC